MYIINRLPKVKNIHKQVYNRTLETFYNIRSKLLENVMGQGYSEVVERLQLYRRAQRKTQKEMCADMGITQSHYAKLESGANVISYDCLKTFENNGGDINFLITGQYCEPGVLDDYMKRCRTREGKLHMHRLIVWAVNMGLALEYGRERKLSEAVYRNLRLAQMEFDMPCSVWKSIRKLDEITQYQMAEILGINIKRYVRLENEMIGPDAEILYRLYSGLSYTPYLAMPSSHCYLRECNDAWEAFSGEMRDRLEVLLVQGAELIRSGEDKGSNHEAVKRQEL